MARPIEILKLVVRGDTKAAVGELKKLGTQAKAIGRRLSQGFESAKQAVFSLRGAIATLGVAALFRSVVGATTEQERVLAQLDARIKSTGGAAGRTREELIGVSAALQKVTTFGDEAIQGMQSLLLTFTQVRGDEFDAATEAVLNMSTAMGTDLKSQALQVGKALNDPILGVTALREAGVQLTEDQQALVKQLTATGDVAGAQRVILEELSVQFGGAARAARTTFGGAIEGLKNALGDLIEGDAGGLEGARQSVEDLTETLQDPDTVEALNRLATSLVTLAGLAAQLGTGFVQASEGLGLLLARGLDGAEDADDNLAIVDAAIKRNARELFHAQNQWDSFWQHVPNQQGYQEALDQLKRLQSEQATLAESRTFIVRELEATPVVPPAEPEEADSTAPQAVPVLVDEAAEEAAEKRRKQIDEMVQSLREEADTHGLTAGQVALYRLEQSGATEDDLERARALVEVIDAKDEAAKQAALLARQQAEEQRLAEQQAEALARYAESVKVSIDPTRVLREELELLNDVKAAGLLLDEEFVEAEKRLQEEIRKAGEEMDDTVSTFRDEARRNTQDIIADGLETALTDGVERGAEGALKAFARMLVQMALQAQAAKIAEKLFGESGDGGDGGGGSGKGGFLGQFLAALVAHDGAVAGDRWAPTRIAPRHIFGDARRYHGGGTAASLGLSSDEVPAILQKGERVLNLEETRDYERGGRLTVVNNIVTPTPERFSQSQGQLAAATASAMLRARNRNR